jgi:hypothetical protein
MALLWSDRGEAQARASLRQVLVGLRKDLGEEVMAAMIVTNEAVALNPEKVTVEAEVAGEELLAGFHLHDPAFEDWLRDERLRHEDMAMLAPQPSRLPLPDKPSIAVLPFSNMSGDPEQEYFADGITEDIITVLTRFRSLSAYLPKSKMLAASSASPTSSRAACARPASGYASQCSSLKPIRVTTFGRSATTVSLTTFLMCRTKLRRKWQPN